MGVVEVLPERLRIGRLADLAGVEARVVPVGEGAGGVIGREVGLSVDDIRAVADETAGRRTGLEPLAKTVLRAAREMTTGLVVADSTFAALRQELDDERLTDLMVTIAYYNGLVRLLETMQVDVEEDYLPYLDEFPLPRS